MTLPLRPGICLLMLLALSGSIGFSELDPPLKKLYGFENYSPPTPNKAQEPLTTEFSLEKAAWFLDSATLKWGKAGNCITCHTHHPYLYGRPLISISGDDPAPREIRQILEDRVTGNATYAFQEMFPVVAATSLAINDALTTKKLHPVTKQALNELWLVQQVDGGFLWGGGRAPLGSSYYAMAIIGVAVGVAPEGYAQTEEAQLGLAGMRRWLAQHPPKELYQKALILWASTYHDRFMTPEEQAKTKEELRAKQLPDGGWSLHGMGDWRQTDKDKQDSSISDGFGTGFSVFVLRQAEVSAQDPAVMRGIAWLKANQRKSGKWFARSVSSDGANFITDTATVFAIMAIRSCENPPVMLARPAEPPDQ